MLAILGETAARLVAAERSTIYMLDPGKAELWSRTAMGDGVGEIRVPLGTGIAGMVALTGETLILDDPYKDIRFNQEIDKRTGYRTRNMMTMPLKSATGTILGVFQLLNKRQGRFGSDDVELLTTLAASAAVAVEMRHPRLPAPRLIGFNAYPKFDSTHPPTCKPNRGQSRSPIANDRATVAKIADLVHFFQNA